LLPTAEAATQGRDPGADPGQREVEEGPGLSGEAVRQAEALEQLEREPERQAHHAEKVAADPHHQRGTFSLNRVRARLVHRLPGRDVRRDLLVRQGPKGYFGD